MYDVIAIYQLKAGAENRDIRFVSHETACSLGREPSRKDYDKVYEVGRGTLGIHIIDKAMLLERIYQIFNIARPEDFKGHSLSVSDVVTLDGEAYYVDTYGFKKIVFI